MDSEFQTKVTQEAARWFGEMLDGNARRAGFFSWLEESPRHVEELLFILADAQDMALLTTEQRSRIQELSRELGYDTPADSKVVPVSPATFRPLSPSAADDTQRQPAKRAHRAVPLRRIRAPLAIAAATVLAVVTLWFWTGPGAWKTYSTKVGEQRALNLADGSIVHLNTDSAVEVRLADTSRSVRLLRGEAMFSVEHDASRPFLVYTSNAVIQAIGTRFVVHRQAAGTHVAVIEGLVQVSEDLAPASVARMESGGGALPTPAIPNPPIHFLAAGEAAEVADAGGVSAPQAVDTSRATAWRQRRLVFEEDTLADIAGEFNRYNATTRITVTGDAAHERFSGTFDADSPEAMMQALERDPAFDVAKAGNEIVIRKRESTDP